MSCKLCKHLALAALIAASVPGVLARSDKRGVCWDEKVGAVGAGHVEAMAPGVAWMYNWGPDAADGSVFSDDFRMEPMAWNDRYDIGRLRAWLTAHPECRYLLGYNEPNLADQAAMTPAQAAAAWPALEALAEEFGVRLVAPALNFTGAPVGGRMWQPYEWYDEFFRLVPDAKVDCLALHCYMNWASAQTWFATEYFYADLYNPAKECCGRYPHLTAFLDRYREANGHFPRMMLTEFCAWENDGAITGVDFQIDQMTQKLQALETSDLVEGYAWFMANSAPGAYPYMAMFGADGALTDLGMVYVHMSDFDNSRAIAPGTACAAKDYVAATEGADRSPRLRPNTDAASGAPLQVELPPAAYPEYNLEVPAHGRYRFTVRAKADAAGLLALYVDSRKVAETPVTDSDWTDVVLEAPLQAGRHRLMVYNAGPEAFAVNAITFDNVGGASLAAVETDDETGISVVTDIRGRVCGADCDTLPRGLYIARRADGSTLKFAK